MGEAHVEAGIGFGVGMVAFLVMMAALASGSSVPDLDPDDELALRFACRELCCTYDMTPLVRVDRVQRVWTCLCDPSGPDGLCGP